MSLRFFRVATPTCLELIDTSPPPEKSDALEEDGDSAFRLVAGLSLPFPVDPRTGACLLSSVSTAEGADGGSFGEQRSGGFSLRSLKDLWLRRVQRKRDSGEAAEAGMGRDSWTRAHLRVCFISPGSPSALLSVVFDLRLRRLKPSGECFFVVAEEASPPRLFFLCLCNLSPTPSVLTQTAERIPKKRRVEEEALADEFFNEGESQTPSSDTRVVSAVTQLNDNSEAGEVCFVSANQLMLRFKGRLFCVEIPTPAGEASTPSVSALCCCNDCPQEKEKDSASLSKGISEETCCLVKRLRGAGLCCAKAALPEGRLSEVCFLADSTEGLTLRVALRERRAARGASGWKKLLTRIRICAQEPSREEEFQDLLSAGRVSALAALRPSPQTQSENFVLVCLSRCAETNNFTGHCEREERWEDFSSLRETEDGGASKSLAFSEASCGRRLLHLLLLRIELSAFSSPCVSLCDAICLSASLCPTDGLLELGVLTSPCDARAAVVCGAEAALIDVDSGNARMRLLTSTRLSDFGLKTSAERPRALLQGSDFWFFEKGWHGEDDEATLISFLSDGGHSVARSLSLRRRRSAWWEELFDKLLDAKPAQFLSPQQNSLIDASAGAALQRYELETQLQEAAASLLRTVARQVVSSLGAAFVAEGLCALASPLPTSDEDAAEAAAEPRLQKNGKDERGFKRRRFKEVEKNFATLRGAVQEEAGTAKAAARRCLFRNVRATEFLLEELLAGVASRVAASMAAAELQGQHLELLDFDFEFGGRLGERQAEAASLGSSSAERLFAASVSASICVLGFFQVFQKNRLRNALCVDGLSEVWGRYFACRKKEFEAATSKPLLASDEASVEKVVSDWQCRSVFAPAEVPREPAVFNAKTAGQPPSSWRPLPLRIGADGFSVLRPPFSEAEFLLLQQQDMRRVVEGVCERRKQQTLVVHFVRVVAASSSPARGDFACEEENACGWRERMAAQTESNPPRESLATLAASLCEASLRSTSRFLRFLQRRAAQIAFFESQPRSVRRAAQRETQRLMKLQVASKARLSPGPAWSLILSGALRLFLEREGKSSEAVEAKVPENAFESDVRALVLRLSAESVHGKLEKLFSSMETSPLTQTNAGEGGLDSLRRCLFLSFLRVSECADWKAELRSAEMETQREAASLWTSLQQDAAPSGPAAVCTPHADTPNFDGASGRTPSREAVEEVVLAVSCEALLAKQFLLGLKEAAAQVKADAGDSREDACLRAALTEAEDRVRRLFNALDSLLPPSLCLTGLS